MPTPAQLFVGIVAGAVGIAYFAFGKKQGRFAPMLAGIALCVYPYFVSTVLGLVLIGAVLVAVPFLTEL